MATISLTLTGTAANLNELLDNFSASYGYQSTIDGAPNPESKQDFSFRMIKEYVRNRALLQKTNVLQTAAVQGVGDYSAIT